MAKKVRDDGIALDFEVGDETVDIINVKRSSFSDLLPCPLLVFSPTTQGSYPVLLFFHGFMLQPNWYKSLLLHISSHRYIIVAPQFSPMVSQSQEVKNARKIVEWLSTNNLDSVLPEKVFPDLQKVAVSGHSRGGKTAFALALGYGGGSSTSNATQLEPRLKISALLGIDPVAGSSTSCLCSPNILQFIPYSFDQSIPVAVIGGGLSNQRAFGVCPPGAPNGVNHAEFFNESKPPCYYFLAKDYGHLDMLDDGTAALIRWVMKSGKGSKDSMRRTVGGLFVAFLKAYLEGQADDLINIVESPNVHAPITLDPVISVE
ncbi:PREDICTED: chlorophyllase-2, chloroplastic-like [Nicotiana attenuata]|uniref:Chlorophyllase-2, chloroplastic n=1 Tax=Nicotiana attenuata TaxID=49451 RepID=A0A1J6KZJ2_NICAT|nr:PREDICTED: chlorophyllase-2, chloroplastic-like [Nicotiana attenuata]OIT27023.1 chlorophyllase-2, chloroplastic [Nicotiana attenuata]